MRILIIDDMPERLRTIEKLLRRSNKDAQLEVLWACNYEEAKKRLRTEGPFDAAFFDHDLGPGCDGHDLARYVTLQLPKELWPKEVLVHSNNPLGTERIILQFKDHGVPARRYSLLG